MATLEDTLTDDLYTERRRKQADGYSDPMDGDSSGDANAAAETETQAEAPAAPKYNYGNTWGYDQGKFDDANHKGFKYDTARVMSQFDPRMGFTPEVLNALNALGYGTFSSSGKDKLSLTGARNAPDAADFTDQDWIKAYGAQDSNTKWMFGGGGAAPQATPETSGPTPSAYTPMEVGGVGGPRSQGTPVQAPGLIDSTRTDWPQLGDTSEWTPQQAAAAGIGWVDKNNPNYGKPGFVGFQGYNSGTTTTTSTTNTDGSPKTDLESMIAKLLADQEKRRAEDAAYRTKIHDSITTGIDDASKPVDTNDPIIRQQMDAFRTNQQRSNMQTREQMAARAAASGMPTGAFDSAVQSGYEEMGTQAAGQEAKLLGDRYAQQLQKLESMLATGAGVLSNDEQIDLQTKIAGIKARLDKLGIDQQKYATDTGKGIADANLGFDYAKLGQDDAHFYDNLGFMIGDKTANLDTILAQMLAGRH